MKRIVLSVLAVFSFALAADAQLSVRPVSTLATGSSSEIEIVGYGFVKNSGVQPVTLVWERKNYFTNPGWHSSICDISQCFDTAVSTSSFTLAAGDSGTLDVHLYAFSNGGTGYSEVCVYPQGDAGNKTCATYNFSAWTLSTKSKAAAKNDIEVYPNPATSKLTIKMDSDKPVTIEIFNMLGQKMMNFNHNGKEATIDLSSLQTGVYILRYADENGNIVSKKFKKID